MASRQTQSVIIVQSGQVVTAIEKQATVLDLLRSRSGVYHSVVRETPRMASLRPPRGSQLPGTHWYYNNWDFNVRGTIFEKVTGRKIFEEFERRIAVPMSLQSGSSEVQHPTPWRPKTGAIRSLRGYSALGQNGHFISVILSKDLVVVHRVLYDPPREDSVPYRDVDTMIRMVIAAAPEPPAK